MTDFALKIPFGAALNEKARAKVLEHVQLMSGRAPAMLDTVDKTNTVAMVKFALQGPYTLPMVQVPIHGSEFERRPWKKGDMGFVTTADFDIGAMTGLRTAMGAADFTRPANLASLVWHPTGNVNFKPAIDQAAHETYGRDGGTITHDGTATTQVRTHKTGGATMQTGGDAGSTDHTMTVHPKNGASIASTVAHTIDAPNAKLDMPGNFTAQKDIMTPGGNVSAPKGTVSGMAGSFLSGVLGMLKFGGGGLSGGGGSNGNLSISNAGVAAPVLQSNAAYTVAQLNEEMPPVPALRGTWAVVTDALGQTAASIQTTDPNGGGAATPPSPPVVAYLSVLVGGGTIACPAWCRGDAWVAG